MHSLTKYLCVRYPVQAYHVPHPHQKAENCPFLKPSHAELYSVLARVQFISLWTDQTMHTFSPILPVDCLPPSTWSLANCQPLTMLCIVVTMVVMR